jgi:predicted GNAT family N-acyltransferase
MEQTNTTKNPESFSEDELQDFIAMVRAGGEVGDAVLEKNIRNAQCLVFLRRDSCLTGVAALKNPLQSYRDTIESKSGVSVDAKDYPFELGYVFVLPSARHQGLSICLTSSALSMRSDKGVFATARTDNPKMHATLKKFGFVQIGDSYVSGRGNHKLQVFTLKRRQ